MERTFPIEGFYDPEHILELENYLGFHLWYIITVVFGEGVYAKPGCSVSAKWNQPKARSPRDCKETVSSILTEEDIPHGYDDVQHDSGLVFVGDLSLLPDSFVEERGSQKGSSDEFQAKKSRFLGVPDEDNAYLETSEQPLEEGVIYPKEVVDISLEERFYCRLLSWYAAPTEAGVQRAVKCGKARYDAIKRACAAHPEYEAVIRLTVHGKFLHSSGKFYGTFSEEMAQQMFEEYDALQSQVEGEAVEKDEYIRRLSTPPVK